jgi:peptidoglycan/LPS O-acetylase OafA/YrhL
MSSVLAKLHLPYDVIEATLGSTHGTIANVLIGVMLMCLVFGPRNRAFKILNSKILSYIGLLSYSIYLWQQIFLSAKYGWVTRFPQNLIFLSLMAAFSFYCIEKPFLRLRGRFQTKVKSPVITMDVTSG